MKFQKYPLYKSIRLNVTFLSVLLVIVIASVSNGFVAIDISHSVFTFSRDAVFFTEGVTLNVTAFLSITQMFVVSVTQPADVFPFTVIVVLPAFLPVTIPYLSTVAMDLSEEENLNKEAFSAFVSLYCKFPLILMVES